MKTPLSVYLPFNRDALRGERSSPPRAVLARPPARPLAHRAGSGSPGGARRRGLPPPRGAAPKGWAPPPPSRSGSGNGTASRAGWWRSPAPPHPPPVSSGRPWCRCGAPSCPRRAPLPGRHGHAGPLVGKHQRALPPLRHAHRAHRRRMGQALWLLPLRALSASAPGGHRPGHDGDRVLLLARKREWAPGRYARWWPASWTTASLWRGRWPAR